MASAREAVDRGALRLGDFPDDLLLELVEEALLEDEVLLEGVDIGIGVELLVEFDRVPDPEIGLRVQKENAGDGERENRAQAHE